MKVQNPASGKASPFYIKALETKNGPYQCDSNLGGI